jgi:hypothetical protein
MAYLMAGNRRGGRVLVVQSNRFIRNKTTKSGMCHIVLKFKVQVSRKINFRSFKTTQLVTLLTGIIRLGRNL